MMKLPEMKPSIMDSEMITMEQFFSLENPVMMILVMMLIIWGIIVIIILFLDYPYRKKRKEHSKMIYEKPDVR